MGSSGDGDGVLVDASVTIHHGPNPFKLSQFACIEHPNAVRPWLFGLHAVAVVPYFREEFITGPWQTTPEVGLQPRAYGSPNSNSMGVCQGTAWCRHLRWPVVRPNLRVQTPCWTNTPKSTTSATNPEPSTSHVVLSLHARGV